MAHHASHSTRPREPSAPVATVHCYKSHCRPQGNAAEARCNSERRLKSSQTRHRVRQYQNHQGRSKLQDPLDAAANDAVRTIVSVFYRSNMNLAPRAPDAALSMRSLREKQRRDIVAKEEAASGLLIPPDFDFPDVEAVVNELVNDLKLERLLRTTSPTPRKIQAVRRQLKSSVMVRFVGLAVHHLYWNVLRAELMNYEETNGISNEAVPSESERTRLLSETLACYSEMSDQVRGSFAKETAAAMPAVLLFLHCAIECLFCRTYALFRLFPGDPGVERIFRSLHNHLIKLLDPQGYHTDYLASIHHRRLSPPLTLATERVARVKCRAHATSPALRVLYPEPSAARARVLISKAGAGNPARQSPQAYSAELASVCSDIGSPRDQSMVLPHVPHALESSKLQFQQSDIGSIECRRGALPISDEEQGRRLYRRYALASSQADNDALSQAKRLRGIKRSKRAELEAQYCSTHKYVAWAR